MSPANFPALDGRCDDIVEDRLLDGAVVLRQPRRGHRAGTDAVLLAAAASVSAGRIADLGAGAGAVGLMLAARHSQARVTLVERDPRLVALARENIALNGLDERAEAVEADVLAPASRRREAGLAAASFDGVVTNPPWFDEGTARPSPDRDRRTAHAFAGGSLEGWLRTAADLLRPRGELVLVHRPDALAALLAGLARGFGAIVLKPIQPRAGEAAIRIIVSARKGSRAPLAIAPPLVLHGLDNRFTPEAEALHRGEHVHLLAHR